jgi:putative ABC transport system permease protein
VQGDVVAAREQLARGDSVIVSDNLAYRHGLRVGMPLVLETPTGERRFDIAAIVTDYTLDIGTVIVDRETYKGLWADDLVNEFLVWLAPGASRDAVSAEISRRVGQDRNITVLTGHEFGTQIALVLDQALLMTQAIQLVAIAIALIGVVNFFLSEVVDRRREIGLLRSVALSQRQTIRLLATEAAIVGTLGGVMAALYAWPVAWLLVTRSTRIVSGWSVGFEFSFSVAVATIVVAALTSMAAAYYPARQAARQQPAELVAVE